MKKYAVILAILLASFSFSNSAFAVVDCATLTPPYSAVPATVCGTNYDSMISWNLDANSCLFVYYNVNSGSTRAYPSNDYQHLYIFGTNFFYFVSVNGIWYQNFGGGDYNLGLGSSYLSSRNLYDSTNQNILIDANWGIPTCTSWTYSDWGDCQEDGTQVRTILTSSPSGCSGGSPILSRSCAYQLTVSPDPVAGGGVASSDDVIQCGYNSNNYCQADFPLNSEVELTAYPNTGYAFAYWDDGTNQSTDNPVTVTMSSTLGVTAKFFKTFRNAVVNFYQTSGYYGQCVNYVRYETGIPWDDFNGAADTTFQQAVDAGYNTGTTPAISSIVVFSRDTLPDVGHVGIVTGINGDELTIQDSNWNLDGMVHSHIVDIGSSGKHVVGYIYYTP